MARTLSISCYARYFAGTILLAATVLWSEVVGIIGNCSLCNVPKHYGHVDTLDKLKPLCGMRFFTRDGNEEYVYNVGICTVAEIDENGLTTAGAIQTPLKYKEGKKVIGNLLQTDVMSGSNWIYLEYDGGEAYDKHCQYAARRTIIMITCDPSATTGNLRWMEEKRNKSSDCYYLFELEHSAVCNLVSPGDDGLSPGSIVCIVLGSVAAGYLFFGILFMRFVRGAKGVYQVPNYEFWQDFGNLQADGCDLIFRCNRNQHQVLKPYHGIGDHQIESANDGEDLDEHLLPM